MENPEISIRELATSQARETVKAIAVAEKMSLLNTEEDLISMIAAGIETAIEEYYQLTENLKNETGGI